MARCLGNYCLASRCNSATDALDISHAKVLQLQPEADQFLFRAGEGWEQKYVGTATVSADVETQAGYTVETDSPVIVVDLENEERFSGPPLLHKVGISSGISVVIGDPDDPWGLFGVHATECRHFDADDVDFVQSVANVLAAAIEHSGQAHQLRLFRQAVERSRHSIYVTDRNGVIEYVNPAFEERTGYREEVAIGQTPDILVSDEHAEEFFRELCETILDGDVWQKDVVNSAKDGETYVVEQTIAPILDDSGKPAHFVVLNVATADQPAVEE